MILKSRQKSSKDADYVPSPDISSAPLADIATSHSPSPFTDPVIIIGGGPTGIRAAQELAAQKIPVTIFNAERWQPYNRVKLTPLLAGDVQIGQVFQEPNFPDDSKVMQYTAHPIIDVNLETKTVTGQHGRDFPYSKLVFATGSRAHIPNIPGIDLAGVYKFRNFDDTEKLVARTFSSRRTVVIGGGLLGLEAARGMANRGVETYIIEHETRLMARQLDQFGGDLLAAKIDEMGLKVITGQAVKSINGDSRVQSVELADGSSISCDTLIICTGIRANIEIARDAGLNVGRGITVDGSMQSSDPDVYAVGECAEFQEQVYGLVGPGLEQAAIAAKNIAGIDVAYSGSLPTTKLKVVGTEIFSMGEVEQSVELPDLDRLSYFDEQSGTYRLLVLRRRRLVGALAIQDWPEINLLQKAISEQGRIWPWQARRFTNTGLVYNETQPASVHEWPMAATVCNCTGVTRGQIGDAILQGCNSYEGVQTETSASTVCGSCKPLIMELLDGRPSYEPIEYYKPAILFSITALIVTMIALLLPGWPYTKSVLQTFQLDYLWLDGFWKQVSGFSLLGLSVLAGFISLRKNISWLQFGSYTFWRLFHIICGATALLVLFFHTGFHLGSNLNFWLMMCFVSLILIGSIAGVVKALEHVLLKRGFKSLIGRSASGTPSTLPIWLHLLAFWPLPVLIALHIFTVYYY